MSDIYVEKLLKPRVTLKKVKLKYEKPKYLKTNIPIYSKKNKLFFDKFWSCLQTFVLHCSLEKKKQKKLLLLSPQSFKPFCLL